MRSVFILSRLHRPSLSYRHMSSGLRGLLAGIPDYKKADYYTNRLNLSEASKLLLDKNFIYNSALNDAKDRKMKIDDYLKNIEINVDSFMNEDLVWDRNEVKGVLDGIVRKKGNFVCLLAGKNTGKSLILNDLALRHLRKVFVVDLRVYGGNILKGLLSVIKDRRHSLLKFIEYSKTKTASAASIAAFGALHFNGVDLEIATEFANRFNELLKDESSMESLTALINKMVEDLGSNVTLVIDEANIAFTITPITTNEEIRSTKLALELFTKMTKQSKTVFFNSIILKCFIIANYYYFPISISS